MSSPSGLFCLVTDRRRLIAAAGRPYREWRPLLLEQIAGAAEGGVDFVQIREPDLDGRELAALAREALVLTAGTATRILLNDRPDVALAAGAAGVHLKEVSPPTARVRTLVGPDLVISRAVHAAGPITGDAPDLWVVGTVLLSSSKPGADTLGIEGLRSVVRVAGDVPVVAIGGLDAASAPRIRGTGAAGIAAVGAFLPDGSGDVRRSVQKLTQTLRFAFDTAGLVS